MPNKLTDYEKKIAKANIYRQRQVERQRKRAASPEYIELQRAKQNEMRLKQIKRNMERQRDPEYIAKQKEKKYKQLERLRSQKSKNELTTHKQKNSTKGLKGRTPTKYERDIGNRIADIGCICCLNQGWINSIDISEQSIKYISLHHVDGRTKPLAHAKVLPLCAYHHDTPAPVGAPIELTPIHRGNKTEWELINGTEDQLLEQVYEMIGEIRPWVEEQQLITVG